MTLDPTQGDDRLVTKQTFVSTAVIDLCRVVCGSNFNLLFNFGERQ